MRVLNLECLTPTESRLFDQVAWDLRADYNALVARLQESLQPDAFGLLHSLFSRNPSCSPLYLRCCRLAFVTHFLSQAGSEVIEVVCDDWWLNRTIQSSFPGVRTRLASISVGRVVLKTILRPFYAYALTALYLLSRVGARCPSARKTFPRHHPITLVDTFVLSGTGGGAIVEGKYKDRYYPGIMKGLTAEEAENVHMLGTLIGYTHHGLGLNQMRTARQSFIIPDDWLTLADYGKLLLAPCSVLGLRVPETTWRGLDITKLVVLEKWFTAADWSPVQGYMYYLFMRRLAEHRVPIRFILDWNENQQIDRGLMLGARRFFPGVRTKGYQGYVVSPLCNPHIHPTPAERRAGVIPDVLSVVGPALMGEAAEFDPELTIELAPAFRFSIAARKEVWESKPRRVLLGLPIAVEESVALMRLLLTISPELRKHGFTVAIRQHPNNHPNALVAALGQPIPPDFKWAAGQLDAELDSTDFFIGNASSTCVEALCKGIYVVIVGSDNGLTQNPIPRIVSPALWTVCYGSAEILTSIVARACAGASVRSSVDFQQLTRALFQPVTRAGIRQLLECEPSGAN